MNHLYAALVAPVAELTARLGWGVLITIGFILTYTLCYNIWSSFAFPFYLDFLHYSKDEVAFASKIFGIIMTILGISLGGYLFLRIGRLPTILIGAIMPVFGNFIYADLALGGANIDMVSHFLALDRLLGLIGFDQRMVRLLAAICYENISTGLAGAAFVAYLSGIVSKRFTAVQYSLLSSLTFLIGSLGRGIAGEAFDTYGYALVFQWTAAAGLFAVLFVLLEWLRVGAERRSAARLAAAARQRGGDRDRAGGLTDAVLPRLDPRPDRLRGALRARRAQFAVADGDHLPLAARLPRLFHLRDIAGPDGAAGGARGQARGGQGDGSRSGKSALPARRSRSPTPPPTGSRWPTRWLRWGAGARRSRITTWPRGNAPGVDRPTRFKLAIACFEAGKSDRARELLEKLPPSGSQSENDRAALLLARLLEEDGETDRALALYAEVGERMPGAEAQCRQAGLLMKLGRSREALSPLAEAERRAKRMDRQERAKQSDMYDWAAQSLAELRAERG